MSDEVPKHGGLAIALKGARADQAFRGIRNPSGVESVGRVSASPQNMSKPITGQAASSGHVSQHAATNQPALSSELELRDQRPLSSEHSSAVSSISRSTRAPRLLQATAEQVQYSKISGLADRSHHLTVGQPTMLTVELFNGTTQRIQRISRGVIIFFILVGLAVIGAVPRIRKKTFKTISKAKTELVTFARHRKPLQKRRNLTNVEGEGTDQGNPIALAKAEDSGPVKPFTTQACGGLISDALAGSRSAPLPVRLQTADCFLIKDDPANAEKVLADVASRIQTRRAASSDGQDAGVMGDAILTLQSSLLKQGKDSAANQIVASGCTEWRQSTACVAKLMVATARRPILPLSSDANKMFASRGLLQAKSEARLWLAGAQLAAANGGDAKTESQRFKYALDSSPKDAIALRKEIYESRVMSLWQRGDSWTLKATIKAALRDLASVPPSDLVKLTLIGELADAGADSRRMHALLTREDILFRARGDLDLLDILGPEALRAGLIKDYTQLLRRTRDYYSTRYHAGAGPNKRLAIWEVRSALAAADADAAIGLLTNYARAFGDDALSHHLRGVAYTGLTDSLPYQRLAALEFQAAVRQKRDWESLYGLGIALIRAHRTAQLPSLLADLTKLTRTSGQRYWLDMLRAELRLSEDKYTDVQRILAPYSNAVPAWITARTMQLQVYQKTGKTQLAEQLAADLKVISGRSPFPTSFEGFASPLGCMALTKRPLE